MLRPKLARMATKRRKTAEEEEGGIYTLSHLPVFPPDQDVYPYFERALVVKDLPTINPVTMVVRPGTLEIQRPTESHAVSYMQSPGWTEAQTNLFLRRLPHEIRLVVADILEAMGKRAVVQDNEFKDCRFLCSMCLPYPTTVIGADAFRDSGIKSIDFGGMLQTIKENVFRYATMKIEIVFPPSLETIESHAFYLSSVVSMRFSGEYINLYSNSLCGHVHINTWHVIFNEYAVQSCGPVTFGPDVGIIYFNPKSFYDHEHTTELDLSTLSMVHIGEMAFSESRLASITLPQHTTLKEKCFYECSSLRTVAFHPDSALKTIPHGAFSGCLQLDDVTFPQGLTSIARRAFRGCSFAKKKLTFPRVAYIGNDAFHNTNLHMIDAPLATYIGADAFSNCYNLHTISLPSARHIGKCAFASTHIGPLYNVPGHVRHFSQSIVQRCTKLKRVFVHANVIDYVEDANGVDTVHEINPN
jgi:hypothetical protein